MAEIRPMRRAALTILVVACGGGSAGPDGGGADLDAFVAADARPGIDAAVVEPPAACGPLAPPSGTVIHVTPADAARLATLVRDAPAGATLVLAAGRYPLPASLQLARAGVTLRSAGDDAASVVLDAEYRVNEAIAVSASNVTVAHVTIRRAVDHAIHAYPLAAAPVVGLRFHGLHVEDAGEQFIKVNSTDQIHWVDDGRVECSTFLMTAEGRTHVEDEPGGCYTGGIDAHGARGWTVRGNRFAGIHCENGSLAEHAIHFWRGSRDTLVENNVIIDCARGIGFGLGPDGGRTYSPDPYPGVAPIGHFGGVIRNNVIWATTGHFDTGVELQQARGARVFHNTLVSSTPPGGAFFSSIDYRFANTAVELRNNLTTRITVRDGAQGTLSHNLEDAPLSAFVDAAGLDFHLAAGATQAIDQGVVVAEAGLDLDGEAHDRGAAPDLGADER
jgi:hypothetical protein